MEPSLSSRQTAITGSIPTRDACASTWPSAQVATPRPLADGRIPYPTWPNRCTPAASPGARSAIPPRTRPSSTIHQSAPGLACSRPTQVRNPSSSPTSSWAVIPNPSSCAPGPHSACASAHASYNAVCGLTNSSMSKYHNDAGRWRSPRGHRFRRFPAVLPAVVLRRLDGGRPTARAAAPSMPSPLHRPVRPRPAAPSGTRRRRHRSWCGRA